MSGVVAQSDLAASAKGMLTYDCTYGIYDGSQPTEKRQRTYRYDSRGRCVQTYTAYPAGINCRTSIKYDYAGNPLTTVEQFSGSGGALTITTERTFDSRGRKLTELTTVNGNTVAHAAFAYDEMGRMTETSLNGNIEITADYNLQGWLTALQAAKKSNGFIINDVIFDETLRYHDTNDILAVPLYAGKIAQLDWQRRMLMSGNNRLLYRYDPQGRLIKAEHRITGIGNSTAGNYCEETEYDLNSNITSFNAVKGDEDIQRVYTLNGNRIVGAEYDSRGNITRIPGKNLQIAYNLINLPRSVTAADGTKIDYSYLSDGAKFRAVSETGVNYLYTGSLRWRLQGGTITPESFAIAGGRATLEANGWTAHYYITDHLGSTRAVTDALGNVLATFDYTPYGELLASSDNTTAGTDYLFTGKENQAKQGAGELYDSKARFMDTGGRFLSIDPLAEEYYHLSPYAYCAGDPVNLVDPDGRKIKISDGSNTYFWMEHNGVWGFYDNNQNLYSGDSEYMNEYSKALIELLSTNTGQDLVTTLVDSEDFELNLTNNGEKYGSSYNSINKEINWKYNKPEAVPTTNGQNSNAVINLGHELAHALYHLNNGDMKKIWYSIKYKDKDGNINRINIPISEIYTTHIENKLRAELNLPLRTFYSELRDEFGILHPIVKDGNSLFYNTNEKTKFKQIYRKKNRYIYRRIL